MSLAITVSVAGANAASAQTPSGNAASAPANNQAKSLTAEQWREDLSFMAAEMKRRHKSLYHAVSQQQFDTAVAELGSVIPSLSRDEVIVGMMRIAAMVGDGHTRVDAKDDDSIAFRSLPLKLYLFEDGLYVRAAAPSLLSLVGAKILGFNGAPTEEALRRVDAIISKDNEMALKLFAPVYLDMPDILHALKLAPSYDEAVLTLSKGGRTWTQTIAAAAVAPPWPDDTDGSFINPAGWIDARRGEQPLWLQAPLDFHRLQPLPAQRAIYTQLNEVSDVKGDTLPQYGRRIRDAAQAQQAKKVIVDLRLNYGGNMDLRNGYIRELIKTEGDDTQLFVLSGRASFSATEAILVDLHRLTKAVFIGEPASSKPNSYSDGYRSKLPNSGISVITSIQWNQLSDQSKAPWTGVDVAAPLTFADYIAGRDPAVEAALSYTPQPTLYERLLNAAQARGADGALNALSAYQIDRRNRYQNLALQVPRAANALYAAKQPEASFALAQRAAGDYPDSVDAWLVLAAIAHATAHDDIARVALGRTLNLEPNNRPARNLEQSLAR